MSRMVVTANSLDEWRREGREIRLPCDALLTPAAKDWIRHTAYPVAWLDASSATSAGAATVGVAGDVSHVSLRSVRSELERVAGSPRVFESSGGRSAELSALRKLCTTVQRGDVGRGLVFVADGAVCACVANKFRGVRACIGNGPAATDEAMRELGINVLIVEYPRRTFHEMRQMIRRFVATGVRPHDEVSQAIAAAEASEG